jgi:hypothetical protein
MHTCHRNILYIVNDGIPTMIVVHSQWTIRSAYNAFPIVDIFNDVTSESSQRPTPVPHIFCLSSRNAPTYHAPATRTTPVHFLKKKLQHKFSSPHHPPLPSSMLAWLPCSSPTQSSFHCPVCPGFLPCHGRLGIRGGRVVLFLHPIFRLRR